MWKDVFYFLAQCLKIQYKSVNLLKIMSSNVDKDTHADTCTGENYVRISHC